MMNRGVSIRYGDVTPEAKESFEPSSNDALFDTIDQLQRYNVDFPDFSNPCDYYSTRLDGVAKPIPSDPADENFGFWSKQIASDGGTLSPTPTIFLSSDRSFSSKGLTLTFDTQNDIYPTEIYIQWKLDDEVVESETFFCDSAEYFCDKSVEGYNGLIIEFYSMNMPYSRLKLRAIDFGKGTIFYGKELRNVKLIQEIDPVSSQISINTADFTLDSAGKTNYNFQARQPINVFFNGELLSTTFVKKATRKSSFLWQLQTEDYIGVMEGVSYYGGIYVSEDAVDLMADIFNTAKVPFEISDELAGANVTGYIPYTTCRDALMQVAFAIQAVVDTSNSDVVKVFTLDNNIKQTIPLNRIMQGQSFTDEEVVTGVEVAVHSYKPITETVDVYDANESGTGQNIFVKFSEPLHDLSIENGNINHSGANYAIIDAEFECVLTGQKYEHAMQIKRVDNPNVSENEPENVVAVESATLISQHNIDNVLEKCYNWFIRTNETSLKIIEGKHDADGEVTYDEKTLVGDKITCDTEYLGQKTGRIIRQTFGLSGGIIVKDSVLK